MFVGFRSNEKIDSILDKYEQQGYNKSYIVRKSIEFYDTHFSKELEKLLNEISNKTELAPDLILVLGLKTLKEKYLDGE